MQGPHRAPPSPSGSSRRLDHGRARRRRPSTSTPPAPRHRRRLPPAPPSSSPPADLGVADSRRLASTAPRRRPYLASPRSLSPRSPLPEPAVARGLWNEAQGPAPMGRLQRENGRVFE